MCKEIERTTTDWQNLTKKGKKLWIRDQLYTYSYKPINKALAITEFYFLICTFKTTRLTYQLYIVIPLKRFLHWSNLCKLSCEYYLLSMKGRLYCNILSLSVWWGLVKVIREEQGTEDTLTCAMLLLGEWLRQGSKACIQFSLTLPKCFHFRSTASDFFCT